MKTKQTITIVLDGDIKFVLPENVTLEQAASVLIGVRILGKYDTKINDGIAKVEFRVTMEQVPAELPPPPVDDIPF